MAEMKFRVLPGSLMKKYLAGFPAGFEKRFHALHESPLSTKSFSFYTSVSAIASSKIEGEKMEVDSFIKHRMLKVSFLPDQVQKPDDLYSAYRFAQTHALTRGNFLQAHRKITAHLLPAKSRGALRKNEMVVLEHRTNRIQYEAASANRVPLLFDDLWKDIRSLKSMDLKIPEAFFMASAIHLALANIHPFEDGNGRAARLLEKWFLAEKLGPKAWFLQSEMHYYRNVGLYYKHLNRLGMFFQELDYSKALPFLRMLPKAIKLK